RASLGRVGRRIWISRLTENPHERVFRERTSPPPLGGVRFKPHAHPLVMLMIGVPERNQTVNIKKIHASLTPRRANDKPSRLLPCFRAMADREARPHRPGMDGSTRR